MRKNAIFWAGITGVFLFALASLLGGFQFDDYNPVSQYISETMAIGTPYGEALRYFGYIPAGFLLATFAFSSIPQFPKSGRVKLGLTGVGIFYGMATILVGIFPCDKGCNPTMVNPSVSQVIHSLAGSLTYTLVPLSILLIGSGLQQSADFKRLSRVAFGCGVVSIIFAGLLFANPLTPVAGLYQRIIETTFIVMVITCAFVIKNRPCSSVSAGR